MPTDDEYQKVKRGLETGKLDVYEAVDLVQDNIDKYYPSLVEDLKSENRPFFRLFSAWCLGKGNIKKSQKALRQAYLKEVDNNTRANIVWAYLGMDQFKDKLLITFLQDKYFLIRIMALKRLGSPQQINLSYKTYMETETHPLAQIEALRKIAVFSDTVNIKINIIGQVLRTSANIFEIDAALSALGKIRHKNALKMVKMFYEQQTALIEANPTLGQSICKTLSDLNESGAYAIIQQIYHKSENQLTKYYALEALAIGGGPFSLKVLGEIRAGEANEMLKKYIDGLIKNTEITKVN